MQSISPAVTKARAVRRWGVAALLTTATLAVAGCASSQTSAGAKSSAGNHGKKTPDSAAAAPAIQPEVLWRLNSARHQTSYLRLDLPVVVSGMRITLGQPTGDSEWVGQDAITLYTTHVAQGTISGPRVEQLTGFPQTASDAGSYLVPLPEEKARGKPGERTYVVTAPFPLYVRISVSPLQDAGEYRIPVRMEMPTAGKKGAQGAAEAAIGVRVSEIALPAEPRVLGVVTTTVQTLAQIYPDGFGGIVGQYLDRTDPDDKAAVAELDELVKGAERQGISLFVEDIGPRVKVDEVGRVTLNWDAYDRVMQPYMDGSAFPDKAPMPVWLAPVPPRRISNSPAQLMQYVAGCAQHFADKGWTAVPAFMHPALIADESHVNKALRAEISRTLKLHMSREMLAVTTPDAQVPQPRLWVVDDQDPKLPPAQGLATEQSVRAWPWVCAARTNPGGGGKGGEQVRGFVWRNGVARAETLGTGREGENVDHPLLVVAGRDAKGAAESILPSLRMVWLSEGLNDTAMAGLLEKRSDPSVVSELYAGVVGRTGLTGPSAEAHSTQLPFAPPGYLYAGWLEDRASWEALPGMLEKLVAAGTPGQRVKVTENDPLFMAAKLWLARARRPVARVGGYEFVAKASRDGQVMGTRVHLIAENPVGGGGDNGEVQMDARVSQLPGDLALMDAAQKRIERKQFGVAADGIADVLLPLAGFLETVDRRVEPSTIEVQEEHGGALLNLPMTLPVYRMKPLAQSDSGTAMQIDARQGDWPAATEMPRMGPMVIGKRYLSRPDLEGGAVRTADQPATARWTYDRKYLYVLIHCPQAVVSDERNNQWPTSMGRWWGTDGVQIQIAGVGAPGENFPRRILQLAFKPGGAMMGRTLTFTPGRPLHYSDGLPGNGGADLKYAVNIDKSAGRIAGYTVEAAIPRKWLGPDSDTSQPAWRVNILRHRAMDLTSMSWSGPVVNDEDVGMMGLIVGKE